MKRVKIIIIRHGYSLGNLTKTFLGHTDLDLAELGFKQADVTAEHLKNEKIDEIYSSDLIRAYNTALPHAKIRGLDIKTSENLREVYSGEWENMSVDAIIIKWGREVFYDQWVDNFGCFRFAGGESVIEAGNRFLNEILQICSKTEAETILVTSHAAVIRSFWGIVCDVPAEKISKLIPFPTNASYSVCYYENGKITTSEYSNDEHLADVGITKVNLV